MISIMARHGVRTREHIAVFLICALALSASAAPAGADEIRIFSGGEPQQALRAVTPEFEKATGQAVLGSETVGVRSCITGLQFATILD